jgi:hypothetical protein
MEITLEHPHYAAQKQTLSRYWDLYVGGEHLKARASEYLTQRQKEPHQVYTERLSRVFYENYIGSIIDWFAATLFKREPVITLETNKQDAKRFFAEFSEDCDLRGSTLTAALRQQFIAALVQGRSYMLVDFPKHTQRLQTRAQEDECGAARAYLVDYKAEDLINWETDEHGAFEWVVVRQNLLKQRRPIKGQGQRETRWLYYDRSNYKVFVRRDSEEDDVAPELVDQGTHGLADRGKVPLLELRLTDGLWLMNRAALLQIEHFNKSNALGWALTMGLFSMPVVYSDREWKQVMGESYYIQLGQQDRFGWTEPEGRVYQIASENLTRLQEEIYRVCYLLHQSRGVNSSAFSQSGLSKQRDFAVTQEVLRAYGDIVKEYLKRVLKLVHEARGDEARVDVSGMDDFDIGDFANDLADAERLMNLGIGSPTLRAQVFKKLAGKYLCDVRQATKDKIYEEIDASIDRLTPEQ